MVPVVALLVIVLLESPGSAVHGNTRLLPEVKFTASGPHERRFVISEDSCGAESFDFNIEPRLDFIANHKTTTRTKAEDQLQCKNCDRSGIPPYINCSNSNTDRLKSARWSCEGSFPDTAYKIASSEINCEYDDVFRQNCVKIGSCVLRFSSGLAGSAGWLLFFFLAQIALCIVALAIYKLKDRFKSMMAKRRNQRRPDLRVDVVEARRRGREEIKRLRAERDFATTNAARVINESESQESLATRS